VDDAVVTLRPEGTRGGKKGNVLSCVNSDVFLKVTDADLRDEPWSFPSPWVKKPDIENKQRPLQGKKLL